MSAKEVVQALLESPRIATAVSAGTAGSGLSTFLEWIPNDIGKLATLVGMVLSMVLIFTHLRRSHNEAALMKIKIANLSRQEKEINYDDVPTVIRGGGGTVSI